MLRFPSILHIDLKALQSNYKMLSTRAAMSETCGVVKADAYGLGADQVVRALYHAGCRTFFVAHLEEALQIDGQYPDIKIYVLNGLLTGEAEEFAAHETIFPVLNNLQDVSVWQNFAARQQKKLPAALHIDTGMNRLGLGTREYETLLSEKEQILQGIDIKFIMSHFSSADEKNHPETPRQAARFAEIMSHFPRVPASLSNSAGIFVSPDYHYDLVRPGMALYGLNPTPHTDNPMQPVVSLQTRILNIQTIKAGESVGYGAAYRAEKEETLATVNLGYADGFLRCLSNKGHLYWQGQACPIRGRVSMDLVTVSIDHLGEKPQAGDMMEVIGLSQSADDLAAAAGTIGYEILTSLGNRYRREYVQEDCW